VVTSVESEEIFEALAVAAVALVTVAESIKPKAKI
jgi:hypothetical protein